MYRKDIVHWVYENLSFQFRQKRGMKCGLTYDLYYQCYAFILIDFFFHTHQARLCYIGMDLLSLKPDTDWWAGTEGWGMMNDNQGWGPESFIDKWSSTIRRRTIVLWPAKERPVFNHCYIRRWCIYRILFSPFKTSSIFINKYKVSMFIK